MSEQRLRWLKQRLLQDPIVLAAPLQTRLDKRPFSQSILTPQPMLDTVQKVALGLLVVPTGLGFVGALFTGWWTMLGITAVLLLLLGLLVWVLKLRSGMVWEATWDKERVTVKDGRYGSPVTWTEPLAAFSGLAQERGYRQRGNQYTPNQPVYGLFLTHPDPAKSILLHASYQPIEPATVAYYQQHLGLTIK